MNMIKKNGGFTLVELIVVIAILAILAGVAIPAYSGYIKKANEAADIATLDAVKTAAVAALATEAGSVTEVAVAETTGNVSAKIGSTSYDLTSANADKKYDDDFKAFNNNSATVNVSGLKYYKSATWTAANGWTGVVK